MNAALHSADSSHGRGPRGITLVELLVVVGLLVGFLGLVVSSAGSRPRRGPEILAAALSAAQSRALGVAEGGALILAPDPAAAAVCTSLHDAVMQPLIEATVSGSLTPGTTSATVTVTPTNGDDVQRAYKILLNGTQDSPGVAPATAWLDFNGATSAVSFRASLGQTANNTVWPKPPAGGTFNALLAQFPAKSSAVVELDEGSAVDLRFSGIGDDRSTAYGRLDGKGAVAVVFDRVGRVVELVQNVPDPGASASGAAQPAIPVGTIYFLVAPRDLVAAGSNTLASDEARWVTLVPQTGRVSVADNVVQAGTDTTAIRAARLKARQMIGVGR